METRNEIWKDIEGYEGYYQVSNFGRVRSVERKIEQISGKGIFYKRSVRSRLVKQIPMKACRYLIVGLHKGGKTIGYYVHRLVARAFIPGYMEGFVVNHKDGDKTNNYVHVAPDGSIDTDKSNLEWVTQKENLEKSIATNNVWNGKKKRVIQMDTDGNILGCYESVTFASIVSGAQRCRIRDVCMGKYGCKTAGGYRWKFADE